MPPQSPHYWCHQCQQEVQVLLAPDPVCQRCNGQFVEEIEPENDPRDFTAPVDEENPTIGSAPGSYYTLNTGGPNANVFQFYDSNSNPPESGGALYGMLQALLNGSLPTPPEQQERNQNVSGNTSNSANFNVDLGTATPGGGDGTRVGRYRQPVMFMGSFGLDGGVRFRTVQESSSQMPGSFQESQNSSFNRTESPRAAENRDPGVRSANMINLIQMISGLSGNPISLNFGGSANPGDYVFSQTGLDNIISQLMEQANSDLHEPASFDSEHAPPPATDDMIEALEKKKLKESDLEKFSHCAICTDDFMIDEEVVNLPCEHAYHGECITPWLKVNGTCPVCRYSLITGQKPKDKPPQENSEITSSTEASTSHQTQTAASSATETSQTPTTTTTASDTRNTTMAWESTIPGAFTWGPGGNGQQEHPNADNTNTNDTANDNPSTTGSQNPTSTNVLDLD